MAATLARPSRPARPRISRLFRIFTPILNAPIARFAGTRLLPFWAAVEHRGRRSGRRYVSPVTTRRTSDGFVIPLAFGPRADWVRNVLANGGCTVRWAGHDYPMVGPEVIDRSAVLAHYSPLLRWLIRAGGVESFLRLRDA